MDEEKHNRSKFLVFKNLVFFTLAFVLIYSVFLALLSLQSSMNRAGSLGVLSMSIMYVGFFVSVLYAPFLVEFCGTKRTLLTVFVAHTLFVIANFYPKWWTMLPATTLLGLLFSPQWTAQSVTITRYITVWSFVFTYILCTSVFTS